MNHATGKNHSASFLFHSKSVWERENPELHGADVHVWVANLDLPAERTEELGQLLSEDERARARRMISAQHKNRSVVVRAFLRKVLAHYVATPPEQIMFEYNQYGKPHILAGQNPDGVTFNLSHSSGVALLAMTRKREIGIDIEQWRTNVVEDNIAERFFSPREVSALRALPKELQVEGFFNCWTRKEAYIKAIGLGLSLPLNRFDVSLVPGEPPSLLHVEGNPAEPAEWSMADFQVRPEFSAALAVHGSISQLRCFRWTD